jgi:pilus assembly protein CpaE
VFLDVPRVAGSAAVELLRTAEVRLIVADATVASVRDVVRRLQAIGGEEAGHRNIVALNHARGETRGEISLAQFEEGIGRPVDFVVPWGKAAVDEALNFGRPVASGKSPITDSIVAMAGDLVGEKPETVSLLKRLLKRR